MREDECYYIALFCRKKYTDKLKSDKLQLKRVTSKKENIFNKIKQMECEIGSYTDKGIPIGSRAALCYNEYIKEKAIDDKYNAILPGDKNKKLFLVQPNPLKSNIVSYATDNFIEEIRDYIDYDTNFEKGFLNALQLMVDSLGWDLSKKTESLDEW